MRCAIIGWLASAVLTSGTGCAFTASAIAHHNSRGTACIETPAFALIDLGIGGAGAISLIAEDEGGWAWTLPSVFLASSVLGGIDAIRCQRRHGSGGGREEAPPASNTAPSFGDAEVDRGAREATPEERGVVPGPPLTPAVSPTRDVIKLQLDPTFVEPHPAKPPATPGSTAREPATPAKIPCGDAPGTACPADHTCAIAGRDAGYCVPERER